MDKPSQSQASTEQSQKTAWIKPALEVVPVSDAMAGPGVTAGADVYFPGYS